MCSKINLKIHDLHTLLLVSGECPGYSLEPPEASFYHNGACFYRQCGNFNWYEARSKCHQLNMLLAVSVWNHSWLYDKRCPKVWLGYSKEDWYYLSPSEGESVILYTVYCTIDSCKLYKRNRC